MRIASNNKTIAKNTVFLYFRMLFTMLVSLYTSRVVLQVLGVDDYGIYQTVGGLVAMLSFLNGALSTGSSRFLTFELGRNDSDKLRKTFSTTLLMHMILALFLALIAETVGLWFIYNKLVIAPERMSAAIFAYHLSILTALVTITQVPYTASIISHERMGIYAYMSIVEVSLKLGIVYLLIVTSWDKLQMYAMLLCLVQTAIALFYRYYCVRNFSETHFRWQIDRSIAKKVLSYSGWNLWANTSMALNQQGTIVLINMFFSPAVVAARAVANQVNMAANQFVQNFRTAANPQIVKRYASGDLEGSKKLLLESTKYSYYLMLLLSLPICLVAQPLLELWLHEVPEYTAVFLQLAIVTSLFQVFDTSFYTALYAKGQIRENALISPTLGFLAFPIVYVMFRYGCSPVSLAWAMLVLYAVLGLIVKPLLIIRIADYRWRDIRSVYLSCLKVTVVAVPIPYTLYSLQDSLFANKWLTSGVIMLMSVINVAFATWFMGMDRNVRQKVMNYIRKNISRCQSQL